jgi:hypothetical protein
MNKRATKRKSATENYILKFLTVSSVSSDSIVLRGIPQRQKCIVMYTTVQVRSDLESLLTQQYACIMCTL